MTKEIQRKPNPGRAWEAATGDSPPINLEARFQNGDACFLAYAYLSYCHFDQSGVIEMHFANRTLRVEGRNLRDLVRGPLPNTWSRRFNRRNRVKAARSTTRGSTRSK